MTSAMTRDHSYTESVFPIRLKMALLALLSLGGVTAELPSSVWVEYVAHTNWTYWNNMLTNESTWETPEGYQDTVRSDDPWSVKAAEEKRAWLKQWNAGSNGTQEKESTPPLGMAEPHDDEHAFAKNGTLKKLSDLEETAQKIGAASFIDPSCNPFKSAACTSGKDCGNCANGHKASTKSTGGNPGNVDHTTPAMRTCAGPACGQAHSLWSNANGNIPSCGAGCSCNSETGICGR